MSAQGQATTNAAPLAKAPPKFSRPVDPAPPTDHPVIPLRPLVVSRPTQSTADEAQRSFLNRPAAPARPPAPGPAISTEVKEIIQKFQAAREAYLAHRRELASQLRDAAGDEREKIRAQISDAREKWLAEQQAAREEFLARAKEIREEFKNRERDKVVDSASEESRRKP